MMENFIEYSLLDHRFVNLLDMIHSLENDSKKVFHCVPEYIRDAYFRSSRLGTKNSFLDFAPHRVHRTPPSSHSLRHMSSVSDDSSLWSSDSDYSFSEVSAIGHPSPLPPPSHTDPLFQSLAPSPLFSPVPQLSGSHISFSESVELESCVSDVSLDSSQLTGIPDSETRVSFLLCDTESPDPWTPDPVLLESVQEDLLSFSLHIAETPSNSELRELLEAEDEYRILDTPSEPDNSDYEVMKCRSRKTKSIFDEVDEEEDIDLFPTM